MCTTPQLTPESGMAKWNYIFQVRDFHSKITVFTNYIYLYFTLQYNRTWERNRFRRKLPWSLLRVFPRLVPVVRFPALGTDYLFSALDTTSLFSRVWLRLPVFPRLAPVACFPALGTGCVFTHRRLVPVTCFLALDTGYFFFPRFTPIIERGNETVSDKNCLRHFYLFSRAWHRLAVFSRLKPVANYSALEIGRLFPAFDNGCGWH